MTRLVLATLAVAACGPVNPPASASSDAPRSSGPPAPIVAVEGGSAGSQLVFVDEDGVRVADLTTRGAGPVRDAAPAWSPDGRFVAFESSRESDNMNVKSLWLVAARPGARLHPLTRGVSADVDPAWSPDGRALYFASNREGSFDLYRLGLEEVDGELRERGAPVRLTDSPGQERHPALSPSGALVYTRADDESGSSIWILEPGQPARRLTDGPADFTPRFSPDGAWIAFSAAVEKRLEGEGEAALFIDQDLYLMPAAGGERQLVSDEPTSHEFGPRWSRDGRYLFATAIYRRISDNRPAAAAVVFVDLNEKPRVLRALVDPSSVRTLDPANYADRMSPTLAPNTLESTRLHHGPLYGELMAKLGQNLDRALRLRGAGQPPAHRP